jgi:hypothetical protein
MVERLLVVLALLVSTAAFAHPLDLGYLEIKSVQGGAHFEVAFELNPQAAENFSRLPGGFSNEERTVGNTGRLFQSTLGSRKILSDGQACEWSQPSAHFAGVQQIRITAQALCPKRPMDTLALNLDFLKNASRTYQILGKLVIEGNEQTFLAEPGNRDIQLRMSSAPRLRFMEFVSMGVRHIGATPGEWRDQNGFHLPDGIDHILFLLALILGGGASFWRILKTATGFTVGHSITLSLASLGLVHLPGRIVESAIALSIVFVAAEALFQKSARSRWRVAALFGLVHGFGFATALEKLHLERAQLLPALLGFNLGVEAGQAVIIVLILPVIYLATQRPVFYRYAVQGGAAVIGIAGSWWFIQRAFG